LEFRKITPEEYELVKNHVNASFTLQDFGKIVANYEIILMVGKWIEVLLVSNQMVKIFKELKNFRNPYFMGVYFGDIKRNKFKISLEGITFIAQYIDDKSILSESGEKKVLYGRDLTKSDLFYIPKQIKKDERSILINKKEEVLALGKYLFDRKKIGTLGDQEKIIKNVIDKGWYLRKGG